MNKNDISASERRARIVHLLVHIIGISPLVVLAVDTLREVSVYPARMIMLRTGSFGLFFLICSFACTPANRVLGWWWAVRLRRPLGLYGFFYALLHLLAYAVLDNMLDFELMLRDLGERRAMSIGLIALGLLIPLAATSTQWWQRKLGKRWKMLHWLVYLAVPLAVLHLFWLERDIIDVPIIYAVVVTILFILRLAPIRRVLTTFRQKAMGSLRSSSSPSS